MNAEFDGVWSLDPDTIFLNHGSFGACPTAVLDRQFALIREIERQPVSFMLRKLKPRWDAAREVLAEFVGASSRDLVFVNNATTGVNTVLKSLALRPGDEILVSNQEYNACRNALDLVARASRASVVVVDVPFPVASAAVILQRFEDALSDRTRLLLIDHVVSLTALVMPVAELIAMMRSRGVEILVDGAHAPGMLDLDLGGLGATYYTGNCHKWMCAPKAAAFLYVSPERQPHVHPLVTSHGANAQVADNDRFHVEFDWVGTQDVTAVLTLPFVIEHQASMLSGGWQSVRERNHQLALFARDTLCDALNLAPPCPDSMIGSMAAVELPAAPPTTGIDPVQQALFERGIEVPVNPWPGSSRRILRASAQLYNTCSDYRQLATSLMGVLAE